MRQENKVKYQILIDSNWWEFLSLKGNIFLPQIRIKRKIHACIMICINKKLNIAHGQTIYF